VTDSERDLGVIIGKDCKNNQQAEKSINQANIALGRIRKTFQFLNVKLLKILYPTYIRPYLEFANYNGKITMANYTIFIRGKKSKLV